MPPWLQNRWPRDLATLVEKDEAGAENRFSLQINKVIGRHQRMAQFSPDTVFGRSDMQFLQRR
jgi:hypothetical protein